LVQVLHGGPNCADRCRRAADGRLLSGANGTQTDAHKGWGIIAGTRAPSRQCRPLCSKR
jgi:hypothetical protein